MHFRATSAPRLLAICAATVTALFLSGCQGVRDKINDRLYKPETTQVDGAWLRDSTFLAKNPRLLFRVERRRGETYVMPVASIGPTTLRTLRMSKRGWSLLDISLLQSGKEIIPIANGVAAAPVKMLQGMWENGAAPLDTVAGCPNPIPIGRVSVPPRTEIAVLNYKAPSDLKMLSEGEMQEAIAGVPNLIAPTVSVTASQLSRYTRSVRQIGRVGEAPGVVVDYHDTDSPLDTGVVGSRRPRHIVIVMEKGVYGYRPGWVYSTTGKANDRPPLRVLEAMDIDGDGKSELFFAADIPDVGSYTIVFKQKHEAWVEFWRRAPARCDR